MGLRSVLEDTPLGGIVRYLRGKRVWRHWTAQDEGMLGFYSQFIGAGDLVFDVGANIGNRTKIFLRLGATVIAAEPLRECAQVLRAFPSKSLTVEQKALGAVRGHAEILVSNATVLSSLSREWVQAVAASGRFKDYTWHKKAIVPVTTIDALITKYGVPSFIKIDVEGYEYEVLQGLSAPVRTISVEFTPELIESTFRCLDYLATLGRTSLNYSLGESMILALDHWVTASELRRVLETFKYDTEIFGDVYIRFAL